MDKAATVPGFYDLSVFCAWQGSYERGNAF